MGPDNDFEIKASEIRLKLVNNNNVDGLIKEEIENDMYILRQLSSNANSNHQIVLKKLQTDYERVIQRAELLKQYKVDENGNGNAIGNGIYADNSRNSNNNNSNGNNSSSSPNKSIVNNHLQMMNGNDDHVARTHLLAIETQNLGEAVLEDLRRQREQIWRTNQALHQTDGTIDHSNAIMRDMWRRAQMNRWITNAILVLMLIIILLVLYLKIK